MTLEFRIVDFIISSQIKVNTICKYSKIQLKTKILIYNLRLTQMSQTH